MDNNFPPLQSHVVIAFDATKELKEHELQLAVTNIRLRGDILSSGNTLLLLGVLHTVLHPMGYQTRVCTDSIFGTSARALEEEVSKKVDSYVNMLQQCAEQCKDEGGTIHHDESNNSSYCVYDSDIATGYGVGSFLFLLSSESLMMGVTKCMCFGRPLAPGGNRAWAIIYFASSWLTFLIAEACLIAGAAKNAYHTKYLYAGNWSCESLRKGVFIAGAVFVVLTMILNVYYYMYFTRATSQAARKTNKTNSTVGMTGYA